MESRLNVTVGEERVRRVKKFAGEYRSKAHVVKMALDLFFDVQDGNVRVLPVVSPPQHDAGAGHA